MDTYTKNNISKQEIQMYIIADKLDICPKIVKITNNSVTLAKYDHTLTNDMNRKKFSEQIRALLMKLHNIGILWIDIHEDNIVISKDRKDVRLIDFGHSKYEHQWDNNDGYDWYNIKSKTLNDYKRLELAIIDWLCRVTSTISVSTK